MEDSDLQGLPMSTDCHLCTPGPPEWKARTTCLRSHVHTPGACGCRRLAPASTWAWGSWGTKAVPASVSPQRPVPAGTQQGPAGAEGGGTCSQRWVPTHARQPRWPPALAGWGGRRGLHTVFTRPGPDTALRPAPQGHGAEPLRADQGSGQPAAAQPAEQGGAREEGVHAHPR